MNTVKKRRKAQLYGYEHFIFIINFQTTIFKERYVITMGTRMINRPKQEAYYRQSELLNGTWDFYPDNESERYDIRVPSYWDTPEEYGYPQAWRDLTYGVYRKEFTVPAEMSDSQIFLEIGALTVLAEAYVNGNRVGGEETNNYLMMMLPYEIDVTQYVTVGEANLLEVHIYGTASFPAEALSDSGKFIFPVGTEFISGIGRRGICGDVKLVGKPKIYISDVQIITDLKKNTDQSDDTITIKVTVENKTDTDKTITIANNAVLVDGGSEKAFDDQSVTISAQSWQTVEIADISWPNAIYWWPHDPKLYVLTTELLENDSVGDTVDSRFGFRQFNAKPDENYFELNGIRANLRGESLDYLNSERNRYYFYDSFNECPSNAALEVVKQTLNEAKELNMNIIRNHIRSFVANELFDYTDEIGLMMIDEGAFWETHQNMDYGSQAISNCSEWVKRWVRVIKNHPSIVMYSTTNESWGTEDAEILMPALREAVLSYDNTRPIYNDGDGNDLPFNDQINLHYSYQGVHMNGFPSIVNTGDIYNSFISGTVKPIGEGETMTPSRGLPLLNNDGSFQSVSGASFFGDDNVVSRAVYARSVGRVTRGARYIGVADFKPFSDMFYALEPIDGTIHPQWEDLTAPGLKPDSLTRPLFNPYDSKFSSLIKGDGYEYYKNSFAPVAAFDKEFDLSNLIGVTPAIYLSNDTLNRTVVVYNDEFTNGTQITVNWEAGYQNPSTDEYIVIDGGSFGIEVEYGMHSEENISFSIPDGIDGAQQLYLKLAVYKNSALMFAEDNMLGYLNEVPIPRIIITNPEIQQSDIVLEDALYKRRIKLVNTGGGLAESWTASGYGDWLNLETTSGILRGEQEVYFTLNTGIMESNTNYVKTLVFTGESGSSSQVDINMTTGELTKSDNIALFTRVEASSSYNSSGWRTTNIVDGRRDSTESLSMGWTSSNDIGTNHTEWIMLDLGKAYMIQTVDLYPRNDGSNTGYGFPVDFTIQLSEDNINWTTVITETGYELPGNEVQSFSFASSEARYIKIEGSSLRSNPNDWNQYRMQLAEIEVYQ